MSGDVVIRNTIEEAVLADAVGIDSFNIAEHYRLDMMDSAAQVMLAAIAWKLKSVTEEAFMLQQFGEQYTRYRREVKALVPYLW